MGRYGQNNPNPLLSGEYQMRKNKIIIQSVLLSIIIVLSGCTTISPDTSNGDSIPEGLYVSLSEDKEFTSIQNAIDNASDNQTVFVFSGVYNESIIINKTITLMGQDPEKTIINGNNVGDVITISDTATCNIMGFTIQGSGSNHAGIKILTSNNNISNVIIKNNNNGIYTQNVNYNNICNNTIKLNDEYGVYLSGSKYNFVKNNVFTDNSYGMRIKARYNQIIENEFRNNQHGVYFCCYANKNVVYFNSFINNSIYNAKDNYNGQTWYNEHVSKGNYWDDYDGIDSNDDGIGDTPYNISSDGSKQDNYPLMDPWS
jgi:parallel beta-helix repeat protein